MFGICIRRPISIADIQYTMSDFIRVRAGARARTRDRARTRAMARARTRARARARTGASAKARARAMATAEIYSRHCIKISDILMSFCMKQYLIDNLFD